MIVTNTSASARTFVHFVSHYVLDLNFVATERNPCPPNVLKIPKSCDIGNGGGNGFQHDNLCEEMIYNFQNARSGEDTQCTQPR